MRRSLRCRRRDQPVQRQPQLRRRYADDVAAAANSSLLWDCGDAGARSGAGGPDRGAAESGAGCRRRQSSADLDCGHASVDAGERACAVSHGGCGGAGCLAAAVAAVTNHRVGDGGDSREPGAADCRRESGDCACGDENRYESPRRAQRYLSGSRCLRPQPRPLAGECAPAALFCLLSCHPQYSDTRMHHLLCRLMNSLSVAPRKSHRAPSHVAPPRRPRDCLRGAAAEADSP